MEKTLLVLAAGMGSRYGGLKQIDPVGPSGETLLDYSVFDALRAGFSRVVFVIRRDFEEEFREIVGGRFESRVDVGYVFQQLNDLPMDFSVPEGRTKPWGTGHAIWCAREAVDGPFLAINADDFYGFGAISGVGRFLEGQTSMGTKFCMAGYPLASTLSASGHVSRGVCQVSERGELLHVREFSRIETAAEGIINREDGTRFTGEERVSMNCWGLTPALFHPMEDLLAEFLAKSGSSEKAEFYIPSVIEAIVTSGKTTVEVLPVDGPWFGVTYREDRPGVVAAIQSLVVGGDYPSPLWSGATGS